MDESYKNIFGGLKLSNIRIVQSIDLSDSVIVVGVIDGRHGRQTQDKIEEKKNFKWYLKSAEVQNNNDKLFFEIVISLELNNKR
ncbi:hypothetical protein Glove_58g72 [Diversispora epigaea]|uniref:Uncharacterized protein n=1 Tax=Diversispora epigaea TaxID=1348612 RepID=A0A397JCY2_9GLOM|nr:hypothetical protein Glove_58g72 [Diversispora epigaea]